jgi:signal transduction histidine kinase
MVLECIEFCLPDLVAEVVQLIRIQANAKGLRMNSRVELSVPRVVRGDPNRLRQVLSNLLGNAVKFTGRGEVLLETSLEVQEGNMATVRFRISDTGIGIRPEQIATLFSPFVQADDSTTRKYGGTGLGLAISKQLVEMMGGAIGIISRGEGQGSTFWFTAMLEVTGAVL